MLVKTKHSLAIRNIRSHKCNNLVCCLSDERCLYTFDQVSYQSEVSLRMQT